MMKTKYLFSAAILAGMFAACTNEDLVTTANNAVSPEDGRPTVNVKLGMGFGDQPNTRLIYDKNKGYQFEVGNKIGAILMDEINADAGVRPFENPDKWAALSWHNKYSLVNYSHTDYPFICKEVTNGGGSTWEADAKMLEGNYFFAYPYEGYDAKRQVSHSIINQKQDGGDAKAAYDSYAKNQFFIGYAQVKEGNDTKEALTKVNMTPVLGGVFFRLKNVASAADLTITKIVLSGTNIRSVLTLDPTEAEYKGEDETKTTGTDYNLRTKNVSDWTKHSEVFNYANYLGEKDDLYENDNYDAETDYVYNIPTEEVDNYKRTNALRAVANTYTTSSAADNYAELSFTENGKEGYLLKAGGANVLTTCIMINPIDVTGKGDLVLSIYTTKGAIKDIDLSQVKAEGTDITDKNTSITGQPIKRVSPEVSNIVDVQFDDNSVQAPVETEINNSDDLKQYVSWITSISGNTRLNVATLANNATIDAETALMIKNKFESAAGGKDGLALYFKQKAATSAALQIAAPEDTDSPEAVEALQNVLNYIIIDGSCPVKVLGTANIGETTLNRDFKTIKNTVQESGMSSTLPANATSDLKLQIEKGGVLNVTGSQLDGNGANPISIEVTNKGTLNVVKAGKITMKLVNATATDIATVNVEGHMTLSAGSENNLKGAITVAKDAYMSGTQAGNLDNKGNIHNHGAIWNIKNVNNSSINPAKVTIYKDATVSNFNENSGIIEYNELSATNKVTGTIVTSTLGTIQYTTVYAKDATKSISTADVVKYSITDLTVNEGTLVSDFGQPGAATYAGAYTATTLKTLVLKGNDIKVTGYPLTMQNNGTFQVEGSVNLGASIVSGTAFDAKSYITGTVTVSAKVAFASAVSAVANSATTAVDYNTLTVVEAPQLKNATINIDADKFLAAKNVKVAANTNNAINANGTFYYASGETLPTSGLSVSGTKENTTISAGTIDDK